MTISFGQRRTLALTSPRAAFTAAASVLTVALAVVVYRAPLNCNDFLQQLFYFETHSFAETFYRMFIITACVGPREAPPDPAQCWHLHVGLNHDLRVHNATLYR